MVQAICAFLEFFYLAQCEVYDTDSRRALDDTDALWQFYCHCKNFHSSGVHTNSFNLPRQHSLNHYIKLICTFGAPNGLCSSIMKSKHIKAVKEPWRHSIRCFLLINAWINLQLLALILITMECWLTLVYLQLRIRSKPFICVSIVHINNYSNM